VYSVLKIAQRAKITLLITMELLWMCHPTCLLIYDHTVILFIGKLPCVQCTKITLLVIMKFFGSIN